MTKQPTLEELIKKAKFSYVNPNLTSANFPSVGVQGELKVVSPGRSVTSEEIIAEMAEQGYVPATAYELFSYVQNNGIPEYLVALGESWLSPYDDRLVPVVIEGEAVLYWVNYNWFGNRSFLFRKSLGDSDVGNLNNILNTSEKPITEHDQHKRDRARDLLGLLEGYQDHLDQKNQTTILNDFTYWLKTVYLKDENG